MTRVVTIPRDWNKKKKQERAIELKDKNGILTQRRVEIPRNWNKKKDA